MNRPEREPHRQAEGRKWARVTAISSRWTEADFTEEELRHAAEIVALLAKGRVVRCQTMYAAGATPLPVFVI